MSIEGELKFDGPLLSNEVSQAIDGNLNEASRYPFSGVSGGSSASREDFPNISLELFKDYYWGMQKVEHGSATIRNELKSYVFGMRDGISSTEGEKLIGVGKILVPHARQTKGERSRWRLCSKAYTGEVLEEVLNTVRSVG